MSDASILAIHGIRPTFELNSNRYSQAQILSEIAGLNTSSVAFNRLMAEFPNQYNGVPIKQIIFTDVIKPGNLINPMAAVTAQANFSFSELQGAIYIYLNPKYQALDTIENRSMTLGEIITHELGHGTEQSFRTANSEDIATAWGNAVAAERGLSSLSPSGPNKKLILYNANETPLPLYGETVRCFLSGTPILMKDYFVKSIEELNVGDVVLSYDEKKINSEESLRGCRVKQLFKSITTLIVDLRGLKCTPGHIFLASIDCKTDDKVFMSIGDILRKDLALVDSLSTSIRARTGAVIGSNEDKVVRVKYKKISQTGKTEFEGFILVRSGIPIRNSISSICKSPRNYVALSDYIDSHGAKIDSDGKVRGCDGFVYDAIDWPENSTLFDTPEMQNWIVQVNGKPYTPPWIVDLTDIGDNGGLQVLGQEPTSMPGFEPRQQHAL